MRDKSRPEIIKASIGALTGIIGLLAAIISLVLGANLRPISIGPISFDIPTPTLATSTPVPPSLPTQVAALQSEVAALRQELNILTQTMASNPNANPDTIALRADLQSIDGRLSVIEQAVLDNPAKALQLTLLSREMDNLKANYQSNLESTRQEIGRIYDLNKWFIGLMFTMAIGLLSLAVSNFIKKPEKPPERQEERKEQKEGPKRKQSTSTSK